MATGMSYRRPGTLPPQTSEFVGRTAELAQTRELLRDSRLVTITGPGGVGKTRLAVQAASGVAEAYRDGAHLIELSTTRDPESLVQALAAGLALADHPGTEPSTGSGTESSTESHTGSGTELDTVLGYLRERELLLILDTCEPVIDACAALTDIVLREAPGVTILATSRQPLDTAGEAVQRLRPLPVPAAGSPGAGRADAVELFALRAAAAVPGFTVTPKNLGDVITVCRRLDGIPLAIELATVRLSALPLHEMAARLGDRLRSLTGERRSGTPRHRTLRAAIEWSYALCTPAEQALWARLSVFADGFDLRAAEAVCSGGELAGEETVSAVISLVDKSLLAAGTTPDADPAAAGQPQAPTFRMLDTIREFGAERLRRADTRTLASPRAGRAERGTANRTRVGRAEASLRGRFIAH
jgi:predicted ATPase